MIEIHNAHEELDQAPVLEFALQNEKARVVLSSYGATLQSFEINYPGFEKRDVVLGYSDWQVYQQLFTQQQSAYFGAIVGPIAGRVTEATIPWKDGIYEFQSNEGKHLLHGGKRNFSNVNWQLLSYEEKPFPSVTLCLETQNAGISLPANLRCEVRYTLQENVLLIDITSIALEDTIANPTQHAYFNPAGHQGRILDCEITVASNAYLELNQDKLPTGKSIQCADWHEKKGIQINQMPNFPEIDHAFKLNSSSKQARLNAPDGFQLTFTTNQPYMQVYIGGQSSVSGKQNTSYHQYSGICLEQQAEPDAPNQLNFSDIYLKKGQKKTNSITINFEQNK
jgi:aldose 1-epimerase